MLTHGHEDHIGAVPHVLPHFDGPIYGTKLTLAFLEPKLEEHGADGRAPADGGQRRAIASRSGASRSSSCA